MKHNMRIIGFLLFICLLPAHSYLLGASREAIERARLMEEDRQMAEAIAMSEKESGARGAGVALRGDLLGLGLTDLDIDSIDHIHAFIRTLDGKRHELGLSSENWQRYSECQINKLRQNIEHYIARVHALKREGKEAAANNFEFSVVALLEALSTNKVFFSGELFDLRLALNGARFIRDAHHGDVFDMNVVNEGLVNKLFYLVSSYQIPLSCGSHALANAFAIGSLVLERAALNSKNIKQRAEHIIINDVIRRYPGEVCFMTSEDALARFARELSPQFGFELIYGKNLFIEKIGLPLFTYADILEQKDLIRKSLEETIENGEPTFFLMHLGEHWTLAAVTKNFLNNRLEIIYLDSRNPYPLVDEIVRTVEQEEAKEGTIKQLDTFIQTVKPRPGAGVFGAAPAGVPLAGGEAGGRARFARPEEAPGARVVEGGGQAGVAGVGNEARAPISAPAAEVMAGGHAPLAGSEVVPGAVPGEGAALVVAPRVEELGEILDFVKGMMPARMKKLEQHKQNPPQTDADKAMALTELEKIESDIADYKRDIAGALARILAGGQAGDSEPKPKVPGNERGSAQREEMEPAGPADPEGGLAQPAAQEAGNWWMPNVSGWMPRWFGGEPTPEADPAPEQ